MGCDQYRCSPTVPHLCLSPRPGEPRATRIVEVAQNYSISNTFLLYYLGSSGLPPSTNSTLIEDSVPTGSPNILSPNIVLDLANIPSIDRTQNMPSPQFSRITPDPQYAHTNSSLNPEGEENTANISTSDLGGNMLQQVRQFCSLPIKQSSAFKALDFNIELAKILAIPKNKSPKIHQ